MSDDVLQKTGDDLRTLCEFPMQEPDVFFVCAPDDSSVDEILNLPDARFPLSFIPTSIFFELHKALLKRKEIDGEAILQLFSIKNQAISNDLIKGIV